MNSKTRLKKTLKDLNFLSELPVSRKYSSLIVEDYPFDGQLLTLSSLYRDSRKFYFEIGGKFSPKVCSTMRGLSALDLFANEIQYSPLMSELLWFKDHYKEVVAPEILMNAFSCYNEISLFHEQNHRILWNLLPPAPRNPKTEQMDFCRYLNFAESLVVTIDLALGDQIGKKYSPVFERAKVIYRPGGEDNWHTKNRNIYRRYLLTLLFVSYLSLELVRSEDIKKAVNYLFYDQLPMNKNALKRGQELSELFTINTNQQWQRRFWKQAQANIAKLQKSSPEPTLYIAEDPLDFEEEFVIANRIFDFFGL